MFCSLQALRLEQLDVTFKAIASGVEEIETIERQVNGRSRVVSITPGVPVVCVQKCARVAPLRAEGGRWCCASMGSSAGAR